MRKSNSIKIPAFVAPEGWHITPKRVERPEKMKLIAFRLSEELVKMVDKVAEKIQLVYMPPLIKGKGYRSVVIRLCVEDFMLRFMGPKDNDDDIESPHYKEMSKVIPIMKSILLMKKLDELPEGIENEQEEINKIMKKYG